MIRLRGIGAYLGVAPEKVYLHTGTRKGAKVLELNVASDCLEPDELPPPLRRLSPDDAENFLCIFKDAFRRHPAMQGDRHITRVANF